MTERTTVDRYIEQFEVDHFYNQTLPEDIKSLITYRMMSNRDYEFNTIEVYVRQLGDTHPLISHSYVNARDRSIVETMANVQAMNEISENMGVVAYGEFGPQGVMGYWPMDSEDKALFLLDTEGQYHLCLGETYSETVYFETIVNGHTEGKAECKEVFTELGIPFNPNITSEEIWEGIEQRKIRLKAHPQKWRDSRYAEIISKPDEVVGYQPIKPESKVSEVKDQNGPKHPKWKFWKRK